MGRGVRGARGTGGFFSRGVCLGTGGLVMTLRRWEPSPLVGVVVVEAGRGRASEAKKEEITQIKVKVGHCS